MRVLTTGLLALFGLVAAPFISPATASAAPWGYSGGTSGPAMPYAPRAQSAPSGSHLEYLGGPVISNVAVQSVYWGAASYEPGVGPGQTPITEFLQGVTDSAHMDWLSEYDTVDQLHRLPEFPGQAIGRGRYAGQTTISVSPANVGLIDTDGSRRISDANISGELLHQLESGAVPPPQLDAAGQVNTVYAIFFPKNVTIADGTAVGGEPGGFCAYHTTVMHDGVPVPYMVLPDFESHQFAQGCGSDPVLFNNFGAVTAHELLETITDPLIGVGVASWFDPTSGLEIADICQPQHATITGGNGLNLVVQKEFSNVANDCVGSRGVPAPVRRGYVDACGLAGRTGFADAGLAADCLKDYAVAQGKDDGTFGENDGLIRSQVSSLLSRLVQLSGGSLGTARSFPDVTPDTVPNAQIRNEIELLAGAGIIAGYPDGLFHPADNLSVAQAVALVTRTLEFLHTSNPASLNIVDLGSTAADYAAATSLGLLDTDATNVRGFTYESAAADGTDRGLLADMLAQAIQQLVNAHVVTKL